jgi:hypothetical protein
MGQTRWRGAVATLALLATVAAGCGADPGDAGRVPGDTGGSGPVIATFEVPNGERFKVELATAELADHARRLLQGEKISAIPIGIVVRDGSAINGPWTWHIDSTRFEFAFATIEVCDGIPSDVEKALITSDMYCPRTAKVVAVDPVS